MSNNSTSNINIEFGAILGPAPLSPYAKCGGIISVAFPPTFNSAIPSSQPGITLPCPSGKSIGWPLSKEESNFVPSISLPV